MHRQQNFVTHGAPLRASRARELREVGLWNVCTPTLDQNLVSNLHITVKNSKHEGHAANRSARGQT